MQIIHLLFPAEIIPVPFDIIHLKNLSNKDHAIKHAKGYMKIMHI